MIRIVRSQNYRKTRSTKKQTRRKKDWVVDQEKNFLLPSFPAITLSVFKAATTLNLGKHRLSFCFHETRQSSHGINAFSDQLGV